MAHLPLKKDRVPRSAVNICIALANLFRFRLEAVPWLQDPAAPAALLCSPSPVDLSGTLLSAGARDVTCAGKTQHTSVGHFRF